MKSFDIKNKQRICLCWAEELPGSVGNLHWQRCGMSSPFIPTWLRKLGELEELGQADAGAGMGTLLPGAAGPWLVALGLRSSWGQTQGVSEPCPGLAFPGGTADQGGKA